jgi:hypothetical protein
LVQARVELWEAVDWYDAREDGLGARLLAEAREVVARIDVAPEAAPLWLVTRTERQVRSRGFRSFPYRAYYVTKPRLVVVAFAHDAQRPGYWVNRLDAPNLSGG